MTDFHELCGPVMEINPLRTFSKFAVFDGWPGVRVLLRAQSCTLVRVGLRYK